MADDYGEWMVTDDERTNDRFPKTLAAAKSMVRAGARRGKKLEVYRRTSPEGFYPYRETDE